MDPLSKFNSCSGEQGKFLGKLKNQKVEIYKTLDNLTNLFLAEPQYYRTVFYIKKQAVMGGQVYYNISNEPSFVNGVIGWVKADDIQIESHSGVDKKNKRFLINGTGSAYKKAWGGSQDVIYEKLTVFKNQEINIHLTELVGKEIWYKGKLNGQIVWVNSNLVTSIQETKTSKLGHLRNSQVRIYKRFGDNSSSMVAGTKYTNSVYYIKKEAIANELRYFLMSTDPSSSQGVIGWVKSDDIASHLHASVDKKSKTYVIKGAGRAYSKAWGGSRNIVYKTLSNFEHQEFQVHLTEKVGNNIWYRGKLSGKTVWIHSSHLSIKKESSTSMLGHVRNSGVRIFKKIGYHTTAFSAGNTYTNSVYYIKKHALINGQSYYLISRQPSSIRGVIGWVKEKDLSVNTHAGVDKKAKSVYLNGIGKAFSKAWGGPKDRIYEDLSKFKNKSISVHLTEKVGNNIWYRGSFQGRTIWIHRSSVK